MHARGIRVSSPLPPDTVPSAATPPRPRATTPARAVTQDEKRLLEVAGVVTAVRRIVRSLRVGASAVEVRTGLRPAQLFTLEFVSESPGISLTELAVRTTTDRTSAAGMIERLMDAGMVTRREGTLDRRRTELFITAKGRRTLACSPQSPTQDLIDGIDAMPAAERTRLAESLQALVRAMGLTEQPAPMLFEEAPDRSAGAVPHATQATAAVASKATRRSRPAAR